MGLESYLMQNLVGLDHHERARLDQLVLEHK
jgi:hypothetical protein